MPAGYPKPKHPGLASKGASRASNRAMVRAAKSPKKNLGTGLSTLSTKGTKGGSRITRRDTFSVHDLPRNG